MGIKTLLNDPPRQDTENLPEFVDLSTALSADIVTFHTPLSFDGRYPSYQLLNAKV
jgi:erythronate-4-phosphate dehydrogenase